MGSKIKEHWKANVLGAIIVQNPEVSKVFMASMYLGLMRQETNSNGMRLLKFTGSDEELEAFKEKNSTQVTSLNHEDRCKLVGEGLLKGSTLNQNKATAAQAPSPTAAAGGGAAAIRHLKAAAAAPGAAAAPPLAADAAAGATTATAAAAAAVPLLTAAAAPGAAAAPPLAVAGAAGAGGAATETRARVQRSGAREESRARCDFCCRLCKGD